MNFEDIQELENAGHEYAADLSRTNRGNGEGGLSTEFGYGILMLLNRISVTQLEAMRRAKPRWVNLAESYELPCLVDATRVVSLNSEMLGSQNVVALRLAGRESPLYVLGSDHDAVRFKLGIDEEWMHPPTPYVSSADSIAADNLANLAESLLTMMEAGDLHQITEAKIKLRAAVDDRSSLPF